MFKYNQAVKNANKNTQNVINDAAVTVYLISLIL